MENNDYEDDQESDEDVKGEVHFPSNQAQTMATLNYWG